MMPLIVVIVGNVPRRFPDDSSEEKVSVSFDCMRFWQVNRDYLNAVAAILLEVSLTIYYNVF